MVLPENYFQFQKEYLNGARTTKGGKVPENAVELMLPTCYLCCTVLLPFYSPMSVSRLYIHIQSTKNYLKVFYPRERL